MRVGVVGCGYWGVNYIRACSELSGVDVPVVCDGDSSRLEMIGRRFPQLSLTNSLDDVARSANVDAVVVATPPESHFKIVKELLRQGKHVLVEKPITTAVSDAEELASIADQSGLALMVGHTFLFNNGVRKVKECMDQPEFGRTYYLHSTRTNLGPIRGDVNVVWDLAPHDVSIFNYLLDSQPEWVSATGSRLLGTCREDVAFVTLGYADNVIGNIHVSWADPNKVRETVVVGSNRRIVFDDLSSLERVRIFEKGVSRATTEVDNFGEFRLLMRDGDIISPRVEVSEPLKEQCAHFVACIEKGHRPLTDGRNGVEVVRVLSAIDRSLNSGGKPAEVV